MIDAWPKVRGGVLSDQELQGQYPIHIIIYGVATRRSSLVASKITLSIPADKADKLPFAGSFSNPSFLPTIAYNFLIPPSRP